MAEIDFDTEFLFEPLVFKKEDVVVEGDALHLRIPLLHAQERPLHIPDGHRQYSFKQVLAHLAIAQSEDDASSAFARENEVALHMTQSPPFVDFARSFVDHALALNPFLAGMTLLLLCEHLRTMRLDASSVRCADVSAYGRGGDILKLLLNSFQPLRDLLR